MTDVLDYILLLLPLYLSPPTAPSHFSCPLHTFLPSLHLFPFYTSPLSLYTAPILYTSHPLHTSPPLHSTPLPPSLRSSILAGSCSHSSSAMVCTLCSTMNTRAGTPSSSVCPMDSCSHSVRQLPNQQDVDLMRIGDIPNPLEYTPPPSPSLSPLPTLFLCLFLLSLHPHPSLSLSLLFLLVLSSPSSFLLSSPFSSYPC